jgi:tetratricopeptide (TPR) repeat protein
MSEQKQAHVAASVDKGMVVSTGGSKRHSAHAKISFVTVGAIILVCLIGVGGYALVHYHDKKSNQASVYTPHFSSIPAAEAAATSASNNLNFDHALADLQSVIGLATTKQEKSDLYIRLASAAQNAGNTSLAIQYYQQRHSIDPSTASIDSYPLAGLYQRAGEKTQAIVQYKIYINYVEANPAAFAPYSAVSVIAPIQTQIQALEGGK